MRVDDQALRFSPLVLTVATLLVLLGNTVVCAQRARRVGGMSAKAKQQTQQKAQQLGGRSGIKNQVQHRVQNHLRGKAKAFYQNHGQTIVKHKAQQNGYTKSQVLNHKAQVKQKLQDGIKDRANARANNWVANRGRDFAQHKLQQYGVNQVQQHGATHTLGQLHDRICHLRHHDHHHLHWGWKKWCAYYPAVCHWWYSYCGPTYYFDPTCTVTYDWYYYHCPAELQTLVSAPEARWNLGLKCVLIPGKGLGIEAVHPDSPAEVAGLKPGMIITSADGIAILDETSMPSAIDRSGGVLRLEVLTSADAELMQITIHMQQVLVADY